MPPRPHASKLPRPHAILLLLALCTLNFELTAQYFSLGTDPASVKWSQVKTGHFKVIFPKELDNQALHVANALEYYRGPGSASLGSNPGKWPVILHNRTIVSNATTPYAPKRIDMLTMPPQDNYPQDWLDQLVIHEFRHSSQYAAINRGFTKALTVLLGQQAVPAVMGLFVPFWCIEGDATATETALSNTGRGRVPSFEMKLRAQFLQKGIYSYDKAYNGSYKDFVPDWYELGYLLVGYTRLEFGLDTWSRVFRRTGNVPVMLVPFSNMLYKETGFGKSRLYNHITSNLEKEWKEADQKLDTSHYHLVKQSFEKYYTDLTQPVALKDGTVIALKSSIDDISKIVVIDTAGKERTLVRLGYMPDQCISGSSGRICWAEMDQDPRWPLENYSVIMVYDLQTRISRQITHKTRYFAPELDSSGKLIAAIENDKEYHSSLVILDAADGSVVHRYRLPADVFGSYPSWSDDGRRIVLVLSRAEGKCLAVVDVNNGAFETILDYSFTEISKPVFHEDYVYFTGSYTGKDNIFAISLADNKLYQITSARFGATDATFPPDGNTLYYANYTAGGYEIVSMNMELGTWNPGTLEPWNPETIPHFDLADKLSGQEQFKFDSKQVPDSAYIIKPYRKGLNLFNFHSWAPLSADVNNIDANPGITLLSQNLLSNSFATMGYEYNLNEKTGKYKLKYSYEGLYPAFDLDMDYGLRRGNYKDSVYYDYDELNLGAWARVPLNWNVKSWYLGVQPYAGYSLKFLYMNPGMEVQFRKDRTQSFNSRLYAYAQSRMSDRDIFPKWAQSLDINFRHTLFDADTASSIFAAELNLYFPGLFRHHSLRFYAGYQDRVAKYYSYSDQILMPNGFSNLYPGKMFSGSVNYTFPVFCPDWKIGPLLYLKRLKANIFYDQAVAFDTDPHQNYYSTGLDLTVDFHLFRWFAPLEAGVRTIYLPQDHSFAFEFLYSANLSY
jgi:hypothetical protein